MKTLEELIQKKREIADKIREIQAGDCVNEDLEDLESRYEQIDHDFSLLIKEYK